MQKSSLYLSFYPEKILSVFCHPILEITQEIRQLADQMLEKMYQSNGIGLAAPQIGRAIQLICIDVSSDQSQPLQLMNPQILKKEGQVMSVEGCLSIPNVYVSVTRAARIQVCALTMNGPQTFWAEDLSAICLQHEIDHLHGKIMLDHLSAFKRDRAIAKFRKHQLLSIKNSRINLK